jgi:ADP-heptose:LPS heptosyltransferase
VLRALGLGDFCTGVPALRALRRAYPDYELVLAAPAVLAPLVAAADASDRLAPTPAYVRAPIRRLPWRGPRPDLAVNLHGSGPESHRALLALQPGRLLAFGAPYGPPWRDDEHEVDRWCRLVAEYGHQADPSDLSLRLPRRPRPRWVATTIVHAGASSPDRQWPVSRFAAVIRRLAADGHRILLTGSAEERVRALAIASAGGLPETAVIAGRTGLADLAAVVAYARLVVSGDTGVAHLATAYRTPSVVLFGPVSPAAWGPPAGRPWHVALWHGPDGLAGIEPDEVLAAAGAAQGGTTQPGTGHAATAR